MDFQWHRVSSDDVRHRQVSAAAVLNGQLARSELVVTVDSSPTKPISHEDLVAILEVVSRRAAHSATAVLIAGMDRKVVDAATEALQFRSPPGCFLLIDEPGRSRWCGNGNSHYGDPGPEAVSALARLQTLVTDYLQDEIDEAGPGVSSGLVRAPTLQVTSRWVDVDILLRATVGTATAGLLMAHRMMTLQGVPIPQDTQVLRVATASMELAEAIARSAGIKVNAEVIIDEFDTSPEELERLRPGTSVILCTDLILTENGIRRAIAEVLNWQAVPIMAVTPFDARQVKGPLVLHNTTVPVVSLAEIAISTSPGAGERKVVDIDPVLRSVVSAPRPVERSYPWDPSDFLDACTSVPHAVTIGHTGQPAHRHFTINLDFGRLIAEDSPLRAEVIHRMFTEVFQWLNKETRHVTIVHPDHSEEFAGRISQLLAEALAERLGKQNVTTCPVRRAVLGWRWAFPESLETLEPGCDVVIVDWGAIEAVTVAQLIRLASEAGAGRIFSLVLASELHKHDERALTMIQAVDSPESSGSIPTRIRFLTTLGISATPLVKCPLCQFTKRLRRDADMGGLPALVEQHVEKLAATLRVKSREDVATSPTDAFGAAITSEQVAEYIRLRIRLLAGMRDTGARQRVADEFATLAEEGDEVIRHAAIRLLATEQDWLKLPPLRFAKSRQAVARLALSVAVDINATRRLRLQALIVLVGAMPNVLVRQLPELWESFSGNSLLTLHLLYHLHRIVQRKRGDVPVGLSVLRDQVTACQEVLKANPSRLSGLNDELDWHLAKLTYQVDLRKAREENTDSRESWRALRTHYPSRLRRHCDAEAAMIRLLLHMENILHGDRLDDSSWVVLRGSWSTVVTFLVNYVLPFLGPLTPILTGAFAEEHFDPDERGCLAELSSVDWIRYVNRLEKQFRRLRETQSCSDHFQDRDDLARQLEVLYRTVLAAGGTDQTVTGDPFQQHAEDLELARLAHFIEACPTMLFRTLRACVESPEVKRLPVRVRLTDAMADFEVFCHEELLSNTISHLIGNAAAGKHREAGQEKTIVDQEISVGIDGEVVTVVFRNEGTVPAVKPGRGITSAQRKLHEFGAVLTPVEPDGHWSYEIQLRLKLWTTSQRKG